MDSPIADVWQQYKSTRDIKLRNRLVEAYRDIVQHQAELVHVKLPKQVELDDLVSAGTFGLMDAIEKFDLSRGIKFTTYCTPRIRGAILDELREMDWVPRLTRSRTAKLANARKTLKFELDREPTDAEVREHLKVGKHEYEMIAGDTAVAVTSLSRKIFETDTNKDVLAANFLTDNKANELTDDVGNNDSFDRMIRCLHGDQKEVVIARYGHRDLTMKETGELIGLHESRVSQIHSQAMLILKADQMREREIIPVDGDRVLLCRQFPDMKFSLAGAARTANVAIDELRAAVTSGSPVGRDGMVFSHINVVTEIVEAKPTVEPIAKPEPVMPKKPEVDQFPVAVQLPSEYGIRHLVCDRFPDMKFSSLEASKTAGVSKAMIYTAVKTGRPTGKSRLLFVKDGSIKNHNGYATVPVPAEVSEFHESAMKILSPDQTPFTDKIDARIAELQREIDELRIAQRVYRQMAG